MSTTTTVAERVIEYVESEDEWFRAAEIAEEIDSSTDYTRMVLNGLHDSDEVQKKEEGQIIGSTIEGEMWVLDTKEHARTVIRMFGDLPDEKVNAMGLDELRSYVKAEIADYTGHIGSKVWYKQT